ncbi:TIR domain-containing protein [Algoriphagus ratkowskyi]|uniref:TIR domain-containing protein n=1 Tax=Algoriphagus ratkowskyi TaxID=57028 RepID=A0A2W7QW73_9BACT|nr:toll/interleukin-1 receptor domain-containing protein [Algoriphagus ratkowskyi]PZX52778.1 TIR domain-containing protein [Algoriphagus ratkowskyi]TXD76279.1 toll/interleukin-1 receptor domain-containing protein [Algoriphagus ratkowskyi]
MKRDKIFISYRQSDTQSEASRLKENLEEVFGQDAVFFDIETIEPGLNFAKAIENTIQQSQVVIVLIGLTWAEVKGESGELRIFEEDDWVRREVAIALAQHGSGTTLIPVLTKDAKPLTKSKLPENIQGLADFQWATLSIKNWRSDVKELIEVLKRQLNPIKPINPPAPLPEIPEFKNIFDSAPFKSSAPFTVTYGLWLKKYKWYFIGIIILWVLIEISYL